MVFNVKKQWVLHNIHCESILNKYNQYAERSKAQKCSILRPQNLESSAGPGLPPSPPPHPPPPDPRLWQ